MKSHGESGDANYAKIPIALPSLQEKLKHFARRDRFNQDKSGLNFFMAPDKTVALQPLPGRKMAKEIITLLLCSNSDGNEGYEPMFIGYSLRPHCFKKNSGQEHGLDYHITKKHG